MIKTDFINRQMELIKLAQEQEKVKERIPALCVYLFLGDFHTTLASILFYIQIIDIAF